VHSTQTAGLLSLISFAEKPRDHARLRRRLVNLKTLGNSEICRSSAIVPNNASHTAVAVQERNLVLRAPRVRPITPTFPVTSEVERDSYPVALLIFVAEVCVVTISTVRIISCRSGKKCWRW